MSQLYEMRMKIEEKIKADGLDDQKIKGKIGLHTGKFLAFITPSSADEPEAIAKLRLAAKEVLNLSL